MRDSRCLDQCSFGHAALHLHADDLALLGRADGLVIQLKGGDSLLDVEIAAPQAHGIAELEGGSRLDDGHADAVVVVNDSAEDLHLRRFHHLGCNHLLLPHHGLGNGFSGGFSAGVGRLKERGKR